MGKWNACTRREFIRKLKRIGFTQPLPGGRHFYMRYGTYTLTVPSNKEYSMPQVKMLLNEIAEGTGRRITTEEWNSL
jgi:hypothetical protein